MQQPVIGDENVDIDICIEEPVLTEKDYARANEIIASLKKKQNMKQNIGGDSKEIIHLKWH